MSALGSFLSAAVRSGLGVGGGSDFSLQPRTNRLTAQSDFHTKMLADRELRNNRRAFGFDELTQCVSVVG